MKLGTRVMTSNETLHCQSASKLPKRVPSASFGAQPNPTVHPASAATRRARGDSTAWAALGPDWADVTARERDLDGVEPDR